MLKLNFAAFWTKKEKDIGYFATVHSLEESERFIFVFKSKEGWKYYTSITYTDIQAFSESQDMNFNDAIEVFRLNYCRNTEKLEPEDKQVFDREQDELIKPETQEQVPQSHSSIVTSKGRDNLKAKAASSSVAEPHVTIDAGDDIVNEAKDYSDFLLKLFNSFEKKVLIAADKIKIDKSKSNNIMLKSFGSFIKDLFNTVNTVAFAKHIRQFIKADLVSGLLAAESELNMDIGFTEAYRSKLNQLQGQQIDGYTINGKKWFGIKGVTKEIQSNIIQTVQDGINKNQTIDQIKEDIKKDFDSFSDWRSEVIARTESNRILSEAKLLGYKESGLEGGKIPKVALDDRTSPICKGMHEKYGNKPIPLDEPFIDDITGKAFQIPPFHPLCRTTIAFRPK